ADFWLNFRGMFVYIRYFAVRDPQGQYLGCLEVSQDLTELRALTGEKRL
ncbi:MAG: PAS domain-containing protein, partial [Latilactobacillus curvatus]